MSPDEILEQNGNDATLVIFDEAQGFSWAPIITQWQAAWRDELLRAAYAAAEELVEAAHQLARTINAGTTWVDVDALEECLRDTPPRETDRFTLNDWAVAGPASDTQRALIREASE